MKEREERRRKTEGRGRRAEDGGQRTEGRGRRTEDEGWEGWLDKAWAKTL